MARMLFWNHAGMETVRRAMDGEPTGQPWRPALDRLRAEADAALARPASSVMDKPQVPPSGDKHDYYSLSPYSWPNPDTPDGLPYVTRDGLIHPDALRTDKYVLLEFMRDVETLTLAWFFFGDESCARRAADRLRVWFLDSETRMNPHLEYGQAIPGKCTGRGVGIIDANKFCPLPDLLTLLRPSGALAASEEERILSWTGEFLDWLLTSDHGREEAAYFNNHGTWYDVLTATLALAVGREAEARQTLAAASARRVATQFAPDGSQPHEVGRTRSYFYSCYNLAAMYDLATLGEHVGLDLWRWRDPEGRGIRVGIDFLAAYADGIRPWPHKEVVADGRAPMWPLLRRAGVAYGDADYEEILRRVPESGAERFRLFWPTTVLRS